MRKNLVLVTVDCLRNDFYDTSTTNLNFLNLLSNKSIYYPNCYTLADNTLSSMPQLLTSTYLNLIPYEESKKGAINVMCQILNPRKSIAETLREHGYNTYAFQTAPHLVPSLGFDKGFDSYNYYNPFLSGSIPFIDDLYKYPFTKADEINSYVRSKDLKEPYFLWIHYSDTHDPYIDTFFPLPASNFLWHKFNQRPTITESGDLLWPEISSRFLNFFKRIYEKKVQFIDDNLYDLFIKSGKFDLDDINFILTSDHGQALGEYNQIGHGYRLIPTPEVSKVPLYLSPSNTSEGRVDNRACTLLDVVPTISDLVDLPKLEIYEGSPLLKPLSNSSMPLVWSNTLDFKNSKFLLKIIKDKYIFWRDDFNFMNPHIFKIENKKIRKISDSSIEKDFINISSNHIKYIKEKQLIYNSSESLQSGNEKLDTEVYNALRALRYV